MDVQVSLKLFISDIVLAILVGSVLNDIQGVGTGEARASPEIRAFTIKKF